MRQSLTTAALLLTTLSALAGTTPKHPRTTTPTVRHASTTTKKPEPKAAVHHDAMDPERATEIQNALIKSGYMTGEPTGAWDADSVAAMQKLQADNGWQTKFTPDSRALIKLGLAGGATASTTSTAPTTQVE